MKIINLNDAREVQMITVEKGDTEFCVTYTRIDDDLFEIHFNNFNEEVCPICGAYRGTKIGCSCEEENIGFNTIPVDELVDILNSEIISSGGSIIKVNDEIVWWNIPSID